MRSASTKPCKIERRNNNDNPITNFGGGTTNCCYSNCPFSNPTFKKTRTNEELKESLNKYKDIINVDSEVSKRKAALETLCSKLSELEKVYKDKDSALNQDYLQHKAIYENLRKEVSLLEENLENISYGLYKPHYDYKTSEEFKQKLEEIIDRQKQAIKNETAIYCPVKWEVGGSKAEGAKMTKHYSKLMLRAFNGECDAAIAKVRWNNIGNMEARIEKAYEAINKLGIYSSNFSYQGIFQL